MKKRIPFCCSEVMLLSILLGLLQLCHSQQPKVAPSEQIKANLTQLASASADNCGWNEPSTRRFPDDTTKVEDDVFEQADAAVVEALNRPEAKPEAVIAQTLTMLQAMSDRINGNWPANRKFRYDLLAMNPAYVVVYHLRSRSTWSVFGKAADASWPEKGRNSKWSRVGEDEGRYEQPNSDQEMELYRLARGPSGRARFLAHSSHVSCGDGITGITYDGYEWNPDGIGSLQTILERKGAASRGDYPQYGPVGKLESSGPFIKLPYCEGSAVDLDVDALLCYLDTYDVAGDAVRFLGTRVNRPDLDTVAKVVRYADARDIRAVQSYSASENVARSMVQLMPPRVLGNATGEDYPPLHGNHQKIDLDGLHFVLERLAGRWIITRFTTDPD